MQGRADGKHSDVIQQAEGERGWKPHVIILETRTPYSLISFFFSCSSPRDAAHAQVQPEDALQASVTLIFNVSKLQMMHFRPACSPLGASERGSAAFLRGSIQTYRSSFSFPGNWSHVRNDAGHCMETIVEAVEIYVRLMNPYGPDAFEIASGRRDDFTDARLTHVPLLPLAAGFDALGFFFIAIRVISLISHGA